MAYKIDLGFDDSFDYEKELKRTDISDSYRKSLETELQKRNDYEAKQPKITNPVAPKPAKTITLGDDYTMLDHNGNTITTSETNKAMSTTQAILDKINSGKTSFSNSLKGLIGQIRGRESFAYDFNSDPLFQQALNSAMMNGQVAMQDTMGQAAALTGGYGSTYATTAANGVYNQHVQGAYDKLPEFYSMALNQYQMEGDELYRQYSMLAEQDATEYARLMDAYNANFSYGSYLDEKDYGRYRDTIADQRYEDELAYNRAWDEKNWEYQHERDDISDERYNTEWEHNIEREEVEDEYRDWQKDMSEAELQYQKEQDYIKNQQYINENDWNGDRKVDVNDSMYAAEWEAQHSGKPSSTDLSPFISHIKGLKTNDQIDTYIEELGAKRLINEDEQEYLSTAFSLPEAAPLNERTWTMTYDGGDNGSGWIDEDARFKDEDGNEYTAKSIFDELVASGMSKSEAEDFVLNLQYNTGAANKKYGKKY